MEKKEKYNQLLLGMSTFYAFKEKVKTSEDLQEVLEKYIKINSTNEEDYMKVIWEYTEPEKVQKYEKITGLSQLEVIPKKLIIDLEEKGEQLDEILIITTEGTKKNISFTVDENGEKGQSSSYTVNENYKSKKLIFSNMTPTEFFKRRIKYWCELKSYPEPKFNEIEINEKSFIPGDELLKIVTHIRDKKSSSKGKDFSLWIDTHGGLRNIQFLMNAIIYLLKDEEIEPKAIYGIEADNGVGKGIITSENEKYRIFTFMAGMNEFINFGSSARLRDYFDKIEKDDSTNELLECIARISEAIQLCNMTKFGVEVENLKRFLGKMGNEVGKSSSIIKIFNDRIYNEYQSLFIDNSCENQIRWCLNKNLIQQALTLVEAGMPREIVEKGILTYSDGKSIYIDKENGKILLLSDFEKICQKKEWKDLDNLIIENISYQVIHSKNELGDKFEGSIEIMLNKSNELSYQWGKIKSRSKNNSLYLRLCIKTTTSTDQKKSLDYFLLIYNYLKVQRNHSNHANGKNDKTTVVKYINTFLELYESLLNKKTITYTDNELYHINRFSKCLKHESYSKRR